jgi:PAS domain S-box-containing protein
MLGRGDHEYSIPFYGERRPILIDLALDPDKAHEKNYVGIKRAENVLVGEAYMPTLKGGEVYLLGTASILRDSKGNVIGAIESIRDITGRRKAEEALIDSEARLRAIIDSAPDAIFIRDLKNRYLLVNKAFPKLFNVPEDRVIGRTFDGLFDDTSTEKIWEETEKILAGQIVEVEVERIVNGNLRIFNMIKAPLRNHLGEIIGICGIGRDITDRRNLETQLFQSQKMEAIGTLAGGIAHDFNNILTAIIGFSELSIEEISGNHPLRENLGQILTAGLRARSLVNQILAFSRQGELAIGPVMPAPLIKEAVKMLRASLPSTIRVKHHIQSPMDTIKADATQLYQVIMNLATNAADAMRDTAGTLEIRVERVDVTQETPELSVHLSPGNYVRLTVKDTGIGMDRATKDRIFEPFFTTKPKGKGTGLGLSVVYGIVKSHKGTILVDSEPGRGSSFDVYFPRVREKESLTKERPRDIPGGTEHILFVDDEASVADAAQKLLERLGYKVTMRTSSVDALEAFRAQPARYDLVISDVTMPNMTGTELTRRILNIRPGMPIILCTGFSELIDDEKMKVLGIRTLIMKPVTYRDLAGKVRQVLDAG